MTFTKTLLSWYKKNQRDLPWRKTCDPYTIWISEVILQQTRVEQGLDYFLRFIERFPTLNVLAGSEEQDVLKAWQGLGYYSRARNLHTAAREIINLYDGIFPDSYEKLVRLKGIGQYTAAAIASIAYNLPYPVVDGNVMRFFSRYFGFSIPVDTVSGRKKIYDQALLMLDRKQPGTFNQAIMEFGALQCKPSKPDCTICLLRTSCHAFRNGLVEQLPVKIKPKKQRTRYFHYMVIFCQDGKKGKFIYLRKREENDVWKNLYDFPLIEANQELDEEKLLSSSEWRKTIQNGKSELIHKSPLYKHILTHQIIFARFYIFRETGKPVTKLPYLLVSLGEINLYPLPRLVEQFLQKTMIVF